MAKTNNTVRQLVFEANHQIYGLSGDMIKLEVIQNAVAQLMDRIDEITYKKWDEDPAMARLSINEIKDTVRLIDMAFYPLFSSLNEGAKKLDNHSNELFDIIVKQGDKTQIGEMDDKKSPFRHGNDVKDNQ